MTPENDEGRLAAALEDGVDDDHPDSARQHEPRSRGRNRQHGSVDLGRTIGAGVARRVGRFEWERALRSESLDLVPGEVKATLFTLATWAGGDGASLFPSQKTIGDAIGKSERTVREHLRAAATEGWLIRSRRGEGRTTRYFLSVPDRQPIADDDRQSVAGQTKTRNDNDAGAESVNRQPVAGQTGSPSPPTTTEISPETKTPSASSLTTPTSDVSPDPVSDVERGALAAAVPTTNGDDMLGASPAAEDAALKEMLGTLTDGLRREARATWGRPGGPEILRYVVDAATDLGGSLDLARVAKLLDSPWEAYRVGSLDGRSGYAIVQTYSDAVAEFERRALDGDTPTMEALKGQEAELALTAAATPIPDTF